MVRGWLLHLSVLSLVGCSSLLGIDDLAGPPDDGAMPDGTTIPCQDETFDLAPLTSPWSTFDGMTATASVGGELVIKMASLSSNDYAGATMAEADLTGVAMEVDVTAYPQKAGSDAHAQWRMGNQFYSLHFEPSQVTLLSPTGAMSGPYPIMAGDRTWRVEHRPVSRQWAASVLRGGMRVDLGSVGADLSTMQLNVVLTAGTFTAVDTPGEVRFDNLRLFCP